MSELKQPNVPFWEDLVLRLIAIYKLIKALISVGLGIGLLRMVHQNVSTFIKTYVIDPFHFDPESRFWAGALEEASKITPHSLRLFSYAAFLYAAIFLTEGFGLYFRKHWAEYMVLISTGSLLPIEFYEIYLKLEWWKVGVVVGNVAILLYLMHRLWLDSNNKALREEARRQRRERSPGSDRGSRMISKVP
jgi:uncharacterized membrane protein (DUF2068 family)